MFQKRALFLAAGLFPLCLAGSVVVENDVLRLEIGSDASARSLLLKGTGEELLVPGSHLPFCSILQERPYDNENFITYPSKPTRYDANGVIRDGDVLEFSFDGTSDVALVRVREGRGFLGFFIEGTRYKIDEVGLKRKTEIDAITFARLSIRRTRHFGAWLNVAWDDHSAIALIADSPETFVDGDLDGNSVCLSATSESRVRLEGVGAALVAGSSRASFLDAFERTELALGLPNGVAARRNPLKAVNALEVSGLSPATVDQVIDFARQGGFGMVSTRWTSFAKSCGHFNWKEDAYPNGAADLKWVSERIHGAGLLFGFHMHYNKVSTNDAYVAGGVPDHRLASLRTMTLAKTVGRDDDVIYLEQDPQGILVQPDPRGMRGRELARHLVQIGVELIRYSLVDGEHAPYRLIGCRRGWFGSSVSDHGLFEPVRHLDVDDWPLFIRADVATTLNEEIARRIAEIQDVARFDSVYFDGAGDVPHPFWANVPKAQKIVWDAFRVKPSFAAGAAHGNWSWHIFNRGGTLDIFPPEKQRLGLERYVLRKARENAESFTDTDFGWLHWRMPDSASVGLTPEILEPVCRAAAEWNAPITLRADAGDLFKHPYAKENLRIFRMWANRKRINSKRH